MAKLAAILVSLILFAVCGWMAWGEYTNATVAGYTDVSKAPVGASGFVSYVTGFPVATAKPVLSENEAQNNVRIALGAIVAFSATMFFAVTGGTGGILSVMVTAFISFFAAAANMLVALVILVQIGWFLFRAADPIEYQLKVFGLVLYGVLSIVTAFTMMRQMPNLVRGRRPGMHAVFKCLLILLIAGAGLAPLGLPTEFVVYGYHGAYALAALCLLSLMFIGLTHGNYQYD